MEPCPFRGSLVALPTPFSASGPDPDALAALIDFHVARRSAGIVVAGSTGESATLTDEERRELIRFAVEHSAGRIPVVAGVGTSRTRTSVELARFAGACEADGALVVVPPYNRPSPRGLLHHFGAVAKACDLPVILYNVPRRTGCDLPPEVVAELARRHGNIVAIKEASGSLERARELLDRCELGLLCGEDRQIADFMQLGAVGVIGVVSNLVPDEVAELCQAAAPDSDPTRAAELEQRLDPLLRALGLDTNPVPVKAGLEIMGLAPATVRGPLIPLEEANRRLLVEALEELGLVGAGAAS